MIQLHRCGCRKGQLRMISQETFWYKAFKWGIPTTSLKVDDQQRNGTALSDEPAQIEMDENVDAASMPTAEYIVACPFCQEECNVKNSTSIPNILTFIVIQTCLVSLLPKKICQTYFCSLTRMDACLKVGRSNLCLAWRRRGRGGRHWRKKDGRSNLCVAWKMPPQGLELAEQKLWPEAKESTSKIEVILSINLWWFYK